MLIHDKSNLEILAFTPETLYTNPFILETKKSLLHQNQNLFQPKPKHVPARRKLCTPEGLYTSGPWYWQSSTATTPITAYISLLTTGYHLLITNYWQLTTTNY